MRKSTLLTVCLTAVLLVAACPLPGTWRTAALIGAAAMALAFGLFVWLPNQQFSYVIWWDSVADDPDYNKIVYRLNGEEKSLRLLLDPEDHGRVIGCAGEPGMAEAMDAAELHQASGS